jgi:ribosome recycling factor
MSFDFSNLSTGLQEVHAWLTKELQGVRTGRATTSLLDAVYVNAYGSKMPLNQVANVGIEDPRTLRVTPWDAALIKDVERGINESDFGVGVSVDERGIRVTFPELTGERRTQLMKIAKDRLEDARISVRKHRDEAWSTIQQMERDGEMSEDEKFRSKELMEKKITDSNDALAALYTKKEKEVIE